ncbi:MAG TPA: type II toxin-antitoxin system VapB family antitoxin [Candidatus Acidoferrum sp.]|nr:type II toxin-antitoxin system VapB family antitoxin [Candidatus Acidoferrum sp.]
MRTTLDLDERLMSRLLKVTKARTKTEAIHVAAGEFIRRRTIERIKTLRGKLPIADNWKTLRDLETYEA